ncbi:MAG: glycosyltransferase family 4 protein [Anaerolineales bacterium]|nr:glycosyltransferase family 4 protein [Anaerolineales bacterium]
MKPPAAPRLLYLLPRYDAESAEHLYHLYDFLRNLQKRVPVEIHVERATGPLPKDPPLHPLRIRLPALRLFEEALVFLAARLRGIEFFYVHYSYTAAVAASIVVRLLGGRAYYWNCGMYADMGPEPGEPWRRKLVFGWNCFCINTSVRLCTDFVTGTPRMAEYYARHARIPLKKIIVLPNFVDIERFQAVDRDDARRALGLPPDRKAVLFLHRVSHRRGADFLPGLARSLRSAAGPLTLLVAGGGPYLSELRRRISELGLQESFDIRGQVPNRDVPVFFRAADLYVMPSDVEGFPRVLIEAMAAGCPFAAYDVGGVRDVIAPEQAECLIEAGDRPAFAALCERVLRDERLRRAWSAAGERRVAFYSQPRVLNAFVRMIEGRPLDWPSFFSREAGE